MLKFKYRHKAPKKKVEKLPMILRDTLAVDRTRLANQRTLLSFFRTGLSLIVTALAIFEFKQDDEAYLFSAWALIALGIFVIIIGFISFFVTKRHIANSYTSNNQHHALHTEE